MLVDSSIETETIGVEEEWQVPNLTESVSVAEDGAVHITLTNLSLDKDYEIRTILTDYQVNEVKGEIVHGEMHEMNTFETPDQVRVKEFNEVESKIITRFLVESGSEADDFIRLTQIKSFV